MRWAWIAATLLFLPAVARADVLVSISKSDQRMAVSVDGVPTYQWAVSTGRSGYDTPSGNFHALRLERVYYSKKYDDAPMPNSVFFYGGYAVHGTNEESRLGNPASHGCVRLTRENAATLFSLVKQHGLSSTRVVISDGPQRSSSGLPMAVLRQRDYTVSRQLILRHDSADRGFTSRRSHDRVRLGREEVNDRGFTSRRGQYVRSAPDDIDDREYTQRPRQDRVRFDRDDRIDRANLRYSGQDRRVRTEPEYQVDRAQGNGHHGIRVKQVEGEVFLRRPKRKYDFDRFANGSMRK